jgi:hypothetical protein
MYPVVKIVKGVLGLNYVIKSPGNNSEILFKANNASIRNAVIICSPCIFLGIFRFQFAFHKRGKDPTEVVIFRDQRTQVLEVAPGISPLLGLCIAYAVDRLNRHIC